MRKEDSLFLKDLFKVFYTYDVRIAFCYYGELFDAREYKQLFMYSTMHDKNCVPALYPVVESYLSKIKSYKGCDLFSGDLSGFPESISYFGDVKSVILSGSVISVNVMLALMGYEGDEVLHRCGDTYYGNVEGLQSEVMLQTLNKKNYIEIDDIYKYNSIVVCDLVD